MKLMCLEDIILTESDFLGKIYFQGKNKNALKIEFWLKICSDYLFVTLVKTRGTGKANVYPYGYEFSILFGLFHIDKVPLDFKDYLL